MFGVDGSGCASPGSVPSASRFSSWTSGSMTVPPGQPSQEVRSVGCSPPNSPVSPSSGPCRPAMINCCSSSLIVTAVGCSRMMPVPRSGQRSLRRRRILAVISKFLRTTVESWPIALFLHGSAPPRPAGNLLVASARCATLSATLSFRVPQHCIREPVTCSSCRSASLRQRLRAALPVGVNGKYRILRVAEPLDALGLHAALDPDQEELAERVLGAWSPTLPPAPAGFPRHLQTGFDLSRTEASWHRSACWRFVPRAGCLRHLPS
jgi:hypothetical protein